MAQTGYTPILIYSSSTTTNAPAAGNLTNSTLGSELAINITDGKLFYKDNANAVQVIGWKITPTSAGGTGLTSYTAGDMVYYASGTTLSKLAIGSADYVMTSSGSIPQWSQFVKAISGGTGQTSYAVGDLLYANTTTTLAKLADVATGNALISGGVGVAPSWGKVGLTTHVSGTLPTANGGTNLASYTANQVFYASSSSVMAQSANLGFDGSILSVNGANGIPLRITELSSIPTNQTAGYIGMSTSAATGVNGDLVLIPRSSGAAAVKVYTGSTSPVLRLNIESGGVVTPGADNTQNFGASGTRWAVIFAGTGTINTSDANEKQDQDFLSEAENKVALKIKALFKKFRFKDSVQAKGNDARIHFGVMAQDVQAAFASENLDANKYGLFCLDVVKDDQGNSKDRLGVRYDELFAFVMAAM
jgi:hypothetical protein